MELKYFVKTGENRRWNSSEYEWDGDNGDYYIYEVSDIQVRNAIEKIIQKEGSEPLELAGELSQEQRAQISHSFVYFLWNNDMLDQLANFYQDELHDYFEDEARSHI